MERPQEGIPGLVFFFSFSSAESTTILKRWETRWMEEWRDRLLNCARAIEL